MKKIALIGAGLMMPVVAFAQVTDVSGLLNLVYNIVNSLIPLLIAIAVLFFIWGVLKYVMAGDDEGSRASGRSMMIWGIVAIFVMVSVWGLVNILVNTTGLDTTAADTPEVPAFVPVP